MAAARAQSIPAWQSNHPYASGDFAIYKGVTYQALRPMTSTPTRTPAAMPSLWQAVNLKAAGRCAAVPPAPTD